MSEAFLMSELADFMAAHPGGTVSQFMAHLKAREEVPQVTVQAGLATATSSVTWPEENED